jgi:uncharacterized protein DUF4911
MQGSGANVKKSFIAKIVKSCNDFAMKSKVQYFRVDRRQIGFLKFILEACDGIVTLSTVDAGQGLVSLSIPPGCERDVSAVMKALAKEIFMEPFVE